jgi:hypothetical protein
MSKYLTFEQVDGVTGYVWKVDGQFRTATQDLPVDTTGNPLQVDARYKIVNKHARTWQGDCVGCPVWLDGVDGAGEFTIQNPPVSFASTDVAALSLDVLDLPDFKSPDLPSIESSSDYPLYDTWIKSDENAMLNATALQDDGACDGFADFRDPLPWDGEGAQPGTFPSVFARSVDVDSGSEMIFAYDRHLSLPENTVDKPLADGGGSLVLATTDLAAGAPVQCHNVERNFYNEDHCILSTLSSACAPNTEPKEVIVLDETNLAGIRALTGGALYSVSGLNLSTIYDTSTGFHAPCAATNKNQWSRWIRDPADVACDNSANLGPGTYAIYQEMIESPPNDRELNYDVVDAERDNMMCDVEDQGKTILGKVKLNDGSCWVHVHPAERDVIDLTGADSSLYSVSGNVATFHNTTDFESKIVGVHSVMGKLGDHVEIGDEIPHNVQEAYRTLEFNPTNKPVLVCGSPDEVRALKATIPLSMLACHR